MRLGVFILVSWLVAPSAWAFDCPTHLAASPYTVAVLQDVGAASGSLGGAGRILGNAPGATVKSLSGKDIAEGGLAGVAVLVIPGGSATKLHAAMGPKGVDRLKEFVSKGGGYVGLCAGAYMAGIEPQPYSLGLLPLRMADRENWRRGIGEVKLKAEPGFESLPWPPGWFYANGPLLVIAPQDVLPQPTAVARFSSDINAGQPLAGRMPEKLAIVRGQYGRGRVVVFSPHPELTPGAGALLEKAVRWAALTEEKP